MSTIHFEKVRAESLFVTEEFKTSEWARGIYEDLDLVVTDDQLPPGHFGTYFGTVMRRTYGNPYVQDLYHLHECVHRRTIGYNPSDSFMNWTRRMIRSETEASLVSECFAYLHIPGLREKTFAHEIWMDKHKQGMMQSENGTRLMEVAIRRRRLETLHAPLNDDYIEHQIWNYGQQNVQWCRIWADPVGYGEYENVPAFRVVEAHLSRPDWFEHHREWLASVSAPHHGMNVPFLRQAIAFQPFFERTNKEFGNHVLVR